MYISLRFLLAVFLLLRAEFLPFARLLGGLVSMGIQFLIKFYPRSPRREDKFYEFLFSCAEDQRAFRRSPRIISLLYVYIRRAIYITLPFKRMNQGINDYVFT